MKTKCIFCWFEKKRHVKGTVKITKTHHDGAPDPHKSVSWYCKDCYETYKSNGSD